MSSKLAALQNRIDNIVATGRDMTEVVSAGARLLPAGWAYARLVEDIELGHQPQEYQGKAKPAQPEVRIGFALYDTGDRKYSNDDGTPYIIRPYSLTLVQNDKAGAHKLFAKMNWTGRHKNFAQMLGEGFMVLIVHVPKSKTDATLVSRIDLNNILPPLDNVSGAPYPIPPARDEDIRYFFFDDPTMEDWNALFIDGTAKDGKSKNIIQSEILGATNFVGSAVEAMLIGNNVAFTRPALTPAAPAAGPAAPDMSQGITSLPPVQPTAPAAPVGLPGQAVSSVAAGPVTVPSGTASATAAAVDAAAQGVVGSVPLPATGVEVQQPSAQSTVSQSAQPVTPTTSPSEVVVPALPQLPALPAVPVV